MLDILIFLCGAAVGFFLRHAYPAKFGKAEELADQAKNKWDEHRP